MRAAATAALIGSLALAAPATAASTCSIRGRPMPGAGPLEWKRSARAPVRMQGAPVLPQARTGNTLVFPGVTAVAGARRTQFAAVNLRTLRPTAFNPDVARTRRLRAMALSPTAMYLAHEPFDDEEAPREIAAYDLRTGARLAAFSPPDFRIGLLGGIAYAGGRVVIGGGPPFGPGIMLGAYDAATGAPVWRSAIDWPVESLAASGSRIFVEVPHEVTERPMLAAIDAADGTLVGGWGSTLVARRYDTPIAGVDARGVYTVVAGRTLREARPYVVATGDGRPVALRRLPSNATTLRPGSGATMLGTLRVKTATSPILIDAVFASNGRVVGTVCRRYQALAMSDSRHVVAWEQLSATRSQLVELVRPRR